MKKWTFLVLLFLSGQLHAGFHPFRFAFISDTHIGSPGGTAPEDLRLTVRTINSMNDIAFVVITGDITELGTNEELKLAKQILDSLQVPWYIIPGNHDTGWSESGGVMFGTVFGDDKFSFDYEGIRFMGCASGPYVRMSDGHVPRQALNWLDQQLAAMPANQPLIFLNHYPIDDGLDNWYEITNRLHHYNTLAILCGHGHANKAMNFEDIPGVMGRSNLRAKEAIGGFNLVDVTQDSIMFTVCKPGKDLLKPWAVVHTGNNIYPAGKKYPRPDYTANDQDKPTVAKWSYHSDAGIISSPAISAEKIIIGNQSGEIACLSVTGGKLLWSYKAQAAVFSSPAISGNQVVFGSADGFIYCLNTDAGKLIWKKQTGAAVLGSPLIHGDTVFIGGSDHHFYALQIHNGQTIWSYDGLDGPVVSTPAWYDGKIIFGAWDTKLYALSSSTGNQSWTWDNGSTIRNYSPAACIPLAINGIIYVVAPDRYISAINAANGKTLWRNNDAAVRESVGLSEDGQWLFAKTMQDTIAAYKTSADKQSAVWKMHAGFGYEHVPSMPVEKDGYVFFGTKNGVIYCIDPFRQTVVWKYKIDHSMVNTVRVIDKYTVVAATMDGQLIWIRKSGY